MGVQEVAAIIAPSKQGLLRSLRSWAKSAPLTCPCFVWRMARIARFVSRYLADMMPAGAILARCVQAVWVIEWMPIGSVALVVGGDVGQVS